MGFLTAPPDYTHTHTALQGDNRRSPEGPGRGCVCEYVSVCDDDGGFIGGVQRASFRKPQISPSSREALFFSIKLKSSYMNKYIKETSPVNLKH